MEKPLYITLNKKWKGLTVFCYKCNTNVSEICKVSGMPIKRCQNGAKHVFKVVVGVPGTNQRRTRKLETRDVNVAIQQAIEFEQQVKSGNFILQPVKEIKKQDENKRHLLVHALTRYIGWLYNEGVPAHRIKERSHQHIKDVERAMRLLVECLRKSGYDTGQIQVNEISDEMIGRVYEYFLIEKCFGNRNFNKYFSYYTSFLNWYGEEYNEPIRNWFEKVKRKKVNANPEAITEEEFNALLNVITPENGNHHYESKLKPSRNYYWPWLIHALKLTLYTGRRREEIINMKFNDIEKDSDGTLLIKVEDYKVNRIQGRTNREEKKYNYVPVTNQLMELLNELGLEKFEGTDTFILAPEITTGRTRVMSDNITRGFSHFYGLLKAERKLTHKSLRKAYISSMNVFTGGNAQVITGHSGGKVLNDHYIDKKVIAKTAQRFEVFSKEPKRKNELENIRIGSKNQSKNPEIAK